MNEHFNGCADTAPKKTNCDNCHFATSDGDCVLNITVPCDWKMPEESGDSNDD